MARVPEQRALSGQGRAGSVRRPRATGAVPERPERTGGEVAAREPAPVVAGSHRLRARADAMARRCVRRTSPTSSSDWICGPARSRVVSRSMGARCGSGPGRIPRATSSPCAWRAPSWIRRGCAIDVAFPFARVTHTGDPSDWSQPELHRTRVVARDQRSVLWERTLDANSYWARAAWSSGALVTAGPHEFRVEPSAGTSRFEMVVEFSASRRERRAAERRCRRRRRARHTGSASGPTAARSISRGAPIRALRSSSGASCSRSTSRRSSAPARSRRRRRGRRSTAGSARRTSRCTGGTPRTSRSGTAPRCSSEACRGTRASFRWRARTRRGRAIAARAGRRWSVRRARQSRRGSASS